VLKLWALIAAIGIELQEKWEHPKHRAHQNHPAVAVLEVGGVDDRVQQQALGIYQDMTLLAPSF
jgi:hypothetical protein